jgi:uncharacterized repeat protein (TIGR03803 family)
MARFTARRRRGGGSDLGTVFKLTPPAPGKTQWTEAVLYSFKSSDGGIPYAGLIFDAKGALYGTTCSGGIFSGFGIPCDQVGTNAGTVFKLTPPAPGHTQWTETVLYTFCLQPKPQLGCIDGANPQAGLILDTSGALYGTTVVGGARGLGTVFQLTPPVGGCTPVSPNLWCETVLHSFTGLYDRNPVAGLICDAKGANGFCDANRGFALYGTAAAGGASNGTVFKLTPLETVLHSFTGLDGSAPHAGLICDAKDANGFCDANRGFALYGTTEGGGLRETARCSSYTETPKRLACRKEAAFPESNGPGGGPAEALATGRNGIRQH